MLKVGDLEDDFQFYVGTNHPKREQKGGSEMTFGISHIEAKWRMFIPLTSMSYEMQDILGSPKAGVSLQLRHLPSEGWCPGAVIQQFFLKLEVLDTYGFPGSI